MLYFTKLSVTVHMYSHICLCTYCNGCDIRWPLHSSVFITLSRSCFLVPRQMVIITCLNHALLNDNLCTLQMLSFYYNRCKGSSLMNILYLIVLHAMKD
jgi:hypothetical protein